MERLFEILPHWHIQSLISLNNKPVLKTSTFFTKKATMSVSGQLSLGPRVSDSVLHAPRWPAGLRPCGRDAQRGGVAREDANGIISLCL